MVKISRTDSKNKDFKQLIQLLDEDLNGRYGQLQASYNQYNTVESIETVVVAYSDLVAIGCGCFKKFDESAIEIKRMFLMPENIGQGTANLILSELEKWGLESGFTKAVLETGIKQVEAIKFYVKNGYEKIDNYGQYIGNQNSICMSKNL